MTRFPSPVADWRMRRRVERLEPGALRAYYQARFPAPDTRWTDVRFVVLDVETTGLDPRRHHLLSAGWITVEDGTIRADRARHSLIRPPDGVEVGHSATIHHITDTDVADARSGSEVMEHLLADLVDGDSDGDGGPGRGAVLVCHFARVETDFIGPVAAPTVGFRPPRLVDTMAWHRDRARRLNEPVGPEGLRLYRLLAHYGLPSVRPHHALSDAYGAALLLCAMAERAGGDGGGPARLGQLLDPRSWNNGRR